ncbi:helix-turn-helix domain-containing protein [Blastopirellula retiformator]|uniref:Bifunctional transcriptional activator/DNA repair enzyme AdaA n=1 Tax=Blastopirellula retiformator TaxID=2527970 RepID=A0A5C5VK72_9BACT|nr:helix-turn-helix domain-containing protein [Blastopirellula retiformator]TWT38350.1 Bifunctional transcriptional activator/DNA repair enzyme AdaA [Blastopirellula retiformator]
MNVESPRTPRPIARSRSVDQWPNWRTMPGWIRDRFIQVEQFEEPSQGWEIAEVILAEAVSGGEPNDFYYLSVVVDTDAERDVEVDFGHGAFRRPSRAGNMLFGDQTYADGYLKGAGPFHNIAFYIRKQAFHDRLCNIVGDDVPPLDVLQTKSFRDDGLQTMLKYLVKQCRHNDAPLARWDSDETIDGICRRLLLFAGQKEPAIGPQDRLQPEGVKQVLEYVDAHFTQDLTRDQLAQIAGVAPGHFTRLFRQTTGETPKRYLLQLRIEKAKQLLLTSSQHLGMAAIAAECGFSSASHFVMEFRKQLGVTPDVFRRYH